MRTPRSSLVLSALVAVGAFASRDLFARDLTLEERIRAQAAVERVYYSHQIGVTRPFEEVYPRVILERKVRTVLARSAALERFWNTPISAAMLREETARIARQTRLPERLREIDDALGGDSFLFQEIVARATLTDRLLRSFYARDAARHAGARAEAEALRLRMLTGALGPDREEEHRTVLLVRLEREENPPDAGPSPDGAVRLGREAFQRLREAAPLRPGEIGALVERPDGFSFTILLEEGSEWMRLATYAVAKRSFDAWWADVEASLDGTAVRATAQSGQPMPALAAACVADRWDVGGISDLPDGRMEATAVWTGTEMIVWGGRDYIQTKKFNTGGRYDPLTDSWSATSMLNAPAGQISHTAVWTGSRMIVWGGGPPFTNAGGLYDPVSDTWSPTRLANAPLPRASHVAVWTGSRMVVWGGSAQGGPAQTGGLYDPETVSWTATSLTGAPAGRVDATAVWTGNRMIVWGGATGSFTYLGDGALFDPASNHWQSMAALAAPTGRARHTAVWTGTKMLVWGGENFSGTIQYPADGGRYDVGTNTWSPMSMSGQPASRSKHTAVWTGDQMIVWGGGEWNTTPGTGGRYDPSTDTWSATGTAGAPQSRWNPVAVWSGSRMIVWGGAGPSAINNAIALNDGGRYNPADDTWTPTSMGTVPAGRSGHTAVWTGNELIVWGGDIPASNGFTTTTNSGGRYDPALDQWRPTTTTAAPAARDGHVAVWSGQSMIVWGGGFAGGRYDPLTDAWLPTSVVGAPTPTFNPVAFWTGKRMLVWGGAWGGSLPGTGGLYDPVADSWSPTTAHSGVRGPAAVWTGTEMLVWSGGPPDVFGSYSNAGYRYSPASNTWQAMSIFNAPSGREAAYGGWTGHDMIVWGGMLINNGTFLMTGGRYDPATNSWSPIAAADTQTPRSGPPAVWTGEEMLIWGGTVDGSVTDTGGRYDPAADSWLPTSTAAAPLPRQNHTATWTPLQLLVWGGATRFESLSTGSRYCACGGSTTTVYQDADGDGHGDGSMPIYACSPPPGSASVGDDCADGDANVWAVPSEVPQLDFADQTGLAWLAPVDAGGTGDSYDLLRSPAPNDFMGSASCLPVDPGTPTAVDHETPPVGGAFFYLVRARNACPDAMGTLGSGSDGTPRAGRSCP